MFTGDTFTVTQHVLNFSSCYDVCLSAIWLIAIVVLTYVLQTCLLSGHGDWRVLCNARDDCLSNGQTREKYSLGLHTTDKRLNRESVTHTLHPTAKQEDKEILVTVFVLSFLTVSGLSERTWIFVWTCFIQICSETFIIPKSKEKFRACYIK